MPKKAKPVAFNKHRCGVIEASTKIMEVVQPIQDILNQSKHSLKDFFEDLKWLERRLNGDNWHLTKHLAFEKAVYDSAVFQLAAAALMAGKKHLDEMPEEIHEEGDCDHVYFRGVCKDCGYDKSKTTTVVDIDQCTHKENYMDYKKIGKQYSVECRICHFIRKPTKEEMDYYFSYETSEKCKHERNQLIGGPYGVQFQCTMNNCGYVRKATKKESKEFHKEEEK